MPVEKYHKLGNKYISYDRENQNVIILTRKVYELKECSEDVLARLLSGNEEDVRMVIDQEPMPLTKDEIDELLDAIEYGKAVEKQ